MVFNLVTIWKSIENIMNPGVEIVVVNDLFHVFVWD
jgi:hypothetical protein